MNGPLVVRASTAAGRFEWLAIDGSSVEHGDAAAVAARAAGAPIRLLLPAAAIALTTVDLPARRLQQARLAAPYVIEEQIISDIDELHFACAADATAGRYALAYLDAARLDAWVAPLIAAGVAIDGAWSEVLALPPAPASGWTALATASGWLVRTGKHTGFAADHALLGAILGVLDPRERPASVDIAIAPDHEAASAAWPGDAETRVRHEHRPALAVLGAGLTQRPPLDLLPARYARRGSGGARRTFIAAAAAAVLALGIHAYALAGRVAALERDLAAVHTTQEALLQDVFPEITRLVNPLAQARQAVAARAAAARPPGALLDALHALAHAQVSPDNDTIELQTLSYGAGEVNLTVQASAVADIERFGAMLADGGAFRAEIRSAETGTDGVIGRLAVIPQ